MKTYKVTFWRTQAVKYDVRADSLEAAIKSAQEQIGEQELIDGSGPSFISDCPSHELDTFTYEDPDNITQSQV